MAHALAAKRCALYALLLLAACRAHVAPVAAAAGDGLDPLAADALDPADVAANRTPAADTAPGVADTPVADQSDAAAATDAEAAASDAALPTPSDATASEIDGADDGTSDGAAAPATVLFIGNSYTYVNDLPAMVVAFAASAGVAVVAAAATLGGATLAHWLTDPGAQAQLAKGGWTWVVIQGQSVEPAADPATFLKNALLLAGQAKKAGAKPAFYQTWPRQAGDALYQETWTGGSPQKLAALLKNAYAAAAQQSGGVRVAVGDAWMATLAQLPEVPLYQEDGSHPTVAGTYLAACVFARTLWGVDPDTVKWVPAGLALSFATNLRAVCKQVPLG